MCKYQPSPDGAPDRKSQRKWPKPTLCYMRNWLRRLTPGTTTHLVKLQGAVPAGCRMLIRACFLPSNFSQPRVHGNSGRVLLTSAFPPLPWQQGRARTIEAQGWSRHAKAARHCKAAAASVLGCGWDGSGPANAMHVGSGKCHGLAEYILCTGKKGSILIFLLFFLFLIFFFCQSRVALWILVPI